MYVLPYKDVRIMSVIYLVQFVIWAHVVAQHKVEGSVHSIVCVEFNV